MLRTTLLAATILVTPVAAFASGGHYQTGYVAVAEPRIAVSIGGGQLNGFNLFYQSGGYPYAAAMPYYPAPVVIRPAYYPAPVVVQPAYYPALTTCLFDEPAIMVDIKYSRSLLLYLKIR